MNNSSLLIITLFEWHPLIQIFHTLQIIFTYYVTCPQGACGRHLDPPRGQCLFGGCSCNLPWTGDGCTIELLAPKIIQPVESQYIVEGTKYQYGLNLTQVCYEII